MALRSTNHESLRNCGVKITPTIKGVEYTTGSGVLYLTPNTKDYNYVITAKHTLQESSKVDYNVKVISRIKIFHPKEKSFELLTEISSNQVAQSVIAFEEDLAIIKIEKNDKHRFPSILVSDEPEKDEKEFLAWGTFAANSDEIHLVNFERNDVEINRYQLSKSIDPEAFKGISGAGLFSATKPCLYGIISGFPNENMANDTIDFSAFSVNSVNKKLQSLKLIPLSTEESEHKRIISERVIDIYQVEINNMILNLEQARRRLQSDILDDWFHDPLMYVDLLSKNYLFKQFEENFCSEGYKAEKWDLFYVPKKRLSHRKAYVGSFKDRIMYMAMVGVLADKLDQAMISKTYSARFNKYSSKNLILNGVEQWKKLKHQLNIEANRMSGKIENKHGCLIEVDILNFYDNINIRLLSTKIKRVCQTSNELHVARQLESFLSDIAEQNNIGLPQNSDASSLLASFYLNQVDVFMSNHCSSYYRFMDDIKIFCKDKYEARRLLQILEFELKRCGLSINSQKTEILELSNEGNQRNISANRKTHFKHFKIDLLVLQRLRRSDDANNRNEAFHLTLKLLKELFEHEDALSGIESSRELNYILGTLKVLVKKEIHLRNDDFIESLKRVLILLQDNPWLTYQVCSILNLLTSDLVKKEFLVQLTPLVLDPRFNTYAYQTYQIWLLFANHKCANEQLQKFAINQIEKNDQTNEAGIASMIIYMCSVDPNFHRVINRKCSEGKFRHKYFQSRLSLIAQRKLEVNSIPIEEIHPSLKAAPHFTNSYKNKDLVLSPRGDSYSDDLIIDQLYSL